VSNALAYLCGEYPRATDTFVQREIRGLRERGLRIETIAVRKPAAREQGTDEQADERRRTHYLLPASPLRILRDHGTMFLRSPRRYLGALRLAMAVRSPGLRSLLYQAAYFLEAGAVASRMKAQGIGHLHNHAPDSSGYVAMIAAAMGGFTYSMTLHGFGIFSEPRRWRLSDKLARCRYAICVSTFGRGQAMLWSGAQHWNKYHVIRCGVEVGQRVRSRHVGRGTRLLFVGRLDHVKGLPLLIDAVQELRGEFPTISLDIVGDGPQREALQRRIVEAGLERHVTIHGYRPQKELSKFFECADACVMTSFAEGIPVVLMEAMAAGVPVVAPNIAGIPELVEHGASGYLYTCSDVGELVASVSALLEDGALRERFAVAGRDVVERRFNLGIELDRLERLIRRSLDDPIDGVATRSRSRVAVTGLAGRSGRERPRTGGSDLVAPAAGNAGTGQ